VFEHDYNRSAHTVLRLNADTQQLWLLSNNRCQ